MREAQVTTAKPVELLQTVSGVDVLDFQDSGGRPLISFPFLLLIFSISNQFFLVYPFKL